MNEWVTTLDDDGAVSELKNSLEQGPMLNDAGLRMLIERVVGSFNGLKVEIFSDEHPPPHFRVIHQGETARFTINDCSPLDGGLNRFRRNIRKWHASNKRLLIEQWNSSRPTDCPVGDYEDGDA